MSVKPHQHNHFWLKTSIWLSTICLIHCITFPIIIALLPIVNIAFEVNHWLEFILLSSTAVIGGYSLIHGYKLHHQKLLPLVFFAIGISIMLSVHYIFHIHGGFLGVFSEISGALFIASALYINLRLTKNHACTTAH